MTFGISVEQLSPEIANRRLVLVATARDLYRQHGLSALATDLLNKSGVSEGKLRRVGLSHAGLLAELGLTEEYARWRRATFTYAGKQKPRWNWKRAVEVASLTLTGGFTGSHSSTLVMRGGDLDQYHAALAGLNKRAMAILAARRLADEEAAKVAKKAEIAAAVSAMQERVLQDQQNFAQGVQVLCDKIQKFETAGTAMLLKFPAISAKYRTITEKMDDYLQRDRKLAGNSSAWYGRSQISYEMNNGIFATNQIHFNVHSLKSDFVSDVEPQMQSAQNDLRICGNTSVPVPTVTPACERLQSLYPAYSKAYRDLATGLADLEAVYQTELRKQQELKSEADRIK